METITSKSLKHPIAVSMVFCGFLLMGLISFFRIPVSLFPNTTYPGLTLQTEYFGVGPQKIEEMITKPLEESVSTVGGIVQMFSTSEEGKSRIHIEFNRDADIDFKSLEIRDKVDLVSGNFPREVQKPVLLRYDPEQKPVFVVVLLSSNRSIYELREIADREIKKMIEGIQGVSEVFVAGGKPREILVSCDMHKIDAHSITMGEILSSLQKHNINSSAGQISQDGGKYPVYVRGRFRNLQEIRNLNIFSDSKGKLVKLKDVSDVSFSYRDDDTAARLNGQDRVTIYVHRSGSANLLEITKGLIYELNKVKRNDLSYEIIYNQADTIRNAVFNLITASSVGIIFVFVTVSFAFHSIQKSFICIFNIFSSFFICSFFLYLFQIDYNLITITGLILSAGFSLVISILFLSSIRDEGILNGVEKVKHEILAVLLIISAVFFPLIFSSSEMRIIYGGLAVVIIVSISVSFITHLAFFPIILNFSDKKKNESGGFVKSFFFHSKILNSKNYLFHNLPEKISGFINKLVQSPVRALALYLSILFCGGIFYSLSKQEFINQLEEKELNGHVEFPSGTSFQITNSIAEKVEKTLSGVSGIKEISSKIDSGQASIIVKLDKTANDPDEFIKFLESKIGDIKPAFVHFSSGSDESTLKEITIDVVGEELKKLDELTRALAKKSGEIDGISNVLLRYKPPRPEVQVVIDKVKSEESGLSSSIIGQIVKYGIQGGVATKFYEDNREIDVKIRYRENFRDSIEKISNYRFKNKEGMYIPITEIASFKEDSAPVKIYRKNKKRLFSFTVRVASIGLDKLMSKLEFLKSYPMPENYRIEFGEGLKKAIESQKRFFFIIVFAFILIYMIIASYFESLTKPLLLLIPLPIPIIVSLTILFFLNIPISIPIYIGVILLAGMVVNQSIFHVREFEKIKDEFIKNRFRIEENFLKRILNPFVIICIVLASFYLPLTLIYGEGGGLLRSISITLLAGILTSTISTPTLNALTFFYRFNPVVKKKSRILIYNSFFYALGEWLLFSLINMYGLYFKYIESKERK